MKALVLLSGCGVFDGSEIHESVSTLICLRKNSIEYECASPNIDMHHVLNHTNGNEINEKRNVLIESSRISRGRITDLSTIEYEKFECLIIPGGFGVATPKPPGIIRHSNFSYSIVDKSVILPLEILEDSINTFLFSFISFPLV